jgi:hypothetical protein
MRKFPADYRQYRVFIGHKNRLRHPDTGQHRDRVGEEYVPTWMQPGLPPGGRR